VVGLDVSLHVGRVLAEAFKRRVPEILVKLVSRKNSAARAGRGFTCGGTANRSRTRSVQFAVPADLEDRLLLPMLNEAVACLREGNH